MSLSLWRIYPNLLIAIINMFFNQIVHLLLCCVKLGSLACEL